MSARRFMWNYVTGESSDYEVAASGLPFYYEPIEESQWVTGYATEEACLADRDAFTDFRRSGGTLKEFMESK